jgi:UDP-4-amino-4-deoxy-L-arabinose-oxoglutarate aminotransferase
MIQHSRPCLDEVEERAVVDLLKSGQLLGGGGEQRFRQALGSSVSLFSSGRLAIQAALEALRLPTGAGVIVQTYVCDAVIWAIKSANLQPVLCDIGAFWTATPETVESVLTDRCAAILLAPPFGFAQCDLGFHQFKLPIIRDLCQSSPATKVHPGDAAVFSFHPTKYICAAGGGAVITNNPKYRQRLISIERRWDEIAPFSNLQAAIGACQISKLESFEARRSEIFEIYRAALPESLTKPLLDAMDIPAGRLFRFVIDTVETEASSFFPLFAAHGITVRNGVDQLAHRAFGLPDSMFPNAVARLSRTLSLPFYPALRYEQAQFIAETAGRLLK